MPEATDTPKRRIMRALRIDEISACDSPAQEGAVMTIVKRHMPSPKEDTVSQPRDIMELADEIQATRQCARTEAMRIARQRRPDLLEKFQTAPAAARPSYGPMAKSAAQSSFDEVIDRIAKRDGIGRSQAMTKARSEAPHQFARAYGTR